MTTTATTNSQVVLITGCSSGFGRALVTEALASGRSLRVIATARRLETIADLREMGAKTLALDITADQASLRCFAEEAVQVYGQIDILVNNAGFLQAGAMEEVRYANKLYDAFRPSVKSAQTSIH
ncbi:hypothetical protein V5O48_019060 [Marasmius crinis-equi]|uniref:Uncharacterized protein n=1 Tax=Marasmius crinis-equi TaxID=585013 RepID=A0ABR3EJG3_9AGAR